MVLCDFERKMKNSEDIISRARRACGDVEFADDPDTLDAHEVDGVRPAAVARPGGEEELSGLLRWADSAAVPVLPRGSGTAMALGRPPAPGHVAVCVSRLNRVVELDAPNLTITVQAGAELGEVQRQIAGQGLWLPLDPAQADRATLGGILAANSSGPRRLLHGSARDFVLGMRVALADGRIIKAGGKTVKNVAGYDLCKLFIGSLGSLGVIVEATLRVVPLPERSCSLAVPFGELDGADSFASKLIRSRLLPAAVEVLDGGAAGRLCQRCGTPDADWLVLAAFEGFEEAVRRQVRDAAAGVSGAEEITGDREVSLWNEVRDFLPAEEDAARLKISVPISHVRDVLADGQVASARIARAGCGIVYVMLSGEPAQIADRTTELRRKVSELGGFLIVESARPEVKELADVWDSPGKSLEMMKRIKTLFDPNNIMARGRFLAGT